MTNSENKNLSRARIGRRALVFCVALALVVPAAAVVLSYRKWNRTTANGSKTARTISASPAQDSGSKSATGTKEKPAPEQNDVTHGTAPREIDKQAPIKDLFRDTSSKQATVVLPLDPGRDSDNHFMIPGERMRVVLQARFAAGPESSVPLEYEARLQNSKLETVHLANHLRATALAGGLGVVSISLPPRVLANGDYQLGLTKRTPDGQAQDVGTYHFTVVQDHPRGE